MSCLDDTLSCDIEDASSTNQPYEQSCTDSYNIPKSLNIPFMAHEFLPEFLATVDLSSSIPCPYFPPSFCDHPNLVTSVHVIVLNFRVALSDLESDCFLCLFSLSCSMHGHCEPLFGLYI